MRFAAALTLVALTVSFAISPATAAPSVEDLFRQFDLFGAWAGNCKGPASPANPHVSITAPNSGMVLEEHDLGSEFAVNRYSVLSAERISPTRLALAVIFQPGTPEQERQKLEFLVRNETRRTMFNQPEGGAVRVKDGIALARHVKTPILRKCE
jgi:hypothetical protein